MAHRTSLLTAVDSRGHVHLVVGANPLAAARCGQSLAVGATPVLVAPAPAAGALLPAALQARVDAGEVRWLRAAFAGAAHLETLGRAAVDGFVDAVFVTDDTTPALAATVAAACRRRRIPVNVVDRADLSSFALLSAHADGPLQIGVTTNGSGCKLAARIRREVVAALPPDLGAACARLGALRRRIQEEDRRAAAPNAAATAATDQTDQTDQTMPTPPAPDTCEDDSYDQTAAFNQLLLPPPGADGADDAGAALAKTRRMRWLAQMCEYWPLKRLAAVTDADVAALLDAYATQGGLAGCSSEEHGAGGAGGAGGLSAAPAGRILLAGAGPGHPDLLTRAVHRALLCADVVLADKLVPQGVLDLVPRRTPVVIARKFPGNAEAAQDELVQQAAAAARAGQTVLRLKQGDPFVYGRGGEEVLRLRAAGFADGRSLFVLPGLTAALSAPLLAGIPPTHRDAADQVLVCTGTGKQGRPPPPPGYRASRTAVFLMALHRITGLVAELTGYTADERAAERTEDENGPRAAKPRRALWPAATPCAVIERASCPDQRVLRTTLAHVAAAVEQEGSRPPGLLVVGRACDVLHAPSAAAPPRDVPWTVEEGFAGFALGDGLPADLASQAGLA